MADDKHYVPGDFYRVDDRSGFKIRAKRTRKEWTGMIVYEQFFELRHPQDFVKGVIDDQTVPEPRPRSTDQFIELNSLGAKLWVYRNEHRAAYFLVQNSPAFNLGINAESNYTNPNGTAEWAVWNGTIPAVAASGYPSNIT